MDSRTRLSDSLLSLIHEYERQEEAGDSIYINDREYQQIITYYEQEGDFQQALTVINRAIDQFSFRSDYLILKARVLIKQGLMSDAMSVIERAESISPGEIELQLLKANILIHNKQHNEAITLIEDLKISATKRELEDILLAEAFFYESVQEFDRMFLCLRDVLLSSPDNEEALYLMGAAVEQSRNFEESIKLHKDILDDYPYNSLAWYNLGQAYSNVNEYNLAVRALEYSYIIDPSFENGYLDCAELYIDQQQYAKALDIYKEAHDVFGEDFDILMSVSKCQHELGMIDQAKRSLFAAIELDAYSEEAYYLLAQCYIQNEDWRSAIKVLRKAISIEGEVEEYYSALALCYSTLQDQNRAKYYYRKAALKGCELSEHWEQYVLYLISLGEYEEASLAIEDSQESTFSYALQYLEAYCLLGQGKTSQGLEVLEEALSESFEEHNIIDKLPEVLRSNPAAIGLIQYFQGQ